MLNEKSMTASSIWGVSTSGDFWDCRLVVAVLSGAVRWIGGLARGGLIVGVVVVGAVSIGVRSIGRSTVEGCSG